MDTITWRKDGQPLGPGRVSQVSSGRSVLYLRPATRTDCGSYSCNASNGISWKETSLKVTVEGLTAPPALHPFLGTPQWFHAQALAALPCRQCPHASNSLPIMGWFSSNSQPGIPPRHEIGRSLLGQVQK